MSTLLPDPSSPSSPTPPRGRSLGLTVFGILAIVVGSFSGCVSILPALGQAAQPQGGGGGMLTVILLYGGFGAFLVACGIGSIRHRRWARPVLLVASWTGLIFGLVVLATVIAMRGPFEQLLTMSMPEQQALPPNAITIIMTVTIATTVVIAILIPLAFVIFYSRKQVRETLAALDPTPSWTERVPLPVLGVCVGLGLSCFTCLAAMSQGSMTAVGGVISGPLAVLVWFVLAVVMGALTVGIYQLRPAGWWATVVVSLFGMAHGVYVFAHPEAMFAANPQHLPAEQLAIMQRFFESMRVPAVVVGVVFSVAWLVFLVVIKKHFVPRATGRGTK